MKNAESHSSSLKSECIAGLTTFSTLAYILFLNPLILQETGMDFGAVMVATILASVVATLIMGLWAGYPFALAPGVGLNAYFTYGVVLSGRNTWQEALGACFIAGCMLILLNLLGIRVAIMNAIPATLRSATTVGIGIFLAFLGLRNIQFLVPHAYTLVTLGDICCPKVALAGLGLLVATVLMQRGVKGAIIISVMLNWLLGLALGLVEWKGLIDMPPALWPTLLQLDLSHAFSPAFYSVVLSFVFVAIFDSTGTLTGLAEQGGFINEKGQLPRAKRAFAADSIGTAAGSLFGTAPVTTYLESAAGIAVGAKTGITAVVVAILFLLALFFAPLASSIPHFATAPVLILIGALMMKQVRKLEWEDATEFVPAFLVIIGIPLTYSIATGIALGFISYPLMKALNGQAARVHPILWGLCGLSILKFLLT